MSVLSTSNTIYSYSYLGLGLMAAREAIFSLGREGRVRSEERMIDSKNMDHCEEVHTRNIAGEMW